MKKTLLLLSLLMLFSLAAAQETVCVYFFYADGCPACAYAKTATTALEEKYPSLDINYLNIAEETDLVIGLYENFEVPVEIWGHVPIVFVNGDYLLGGNVIAEELEGKVINCLDSGCPCSVTEGRAPADGPEMPPIVVIDGNTSQPVAPEPSETAGPEEPKVSLLQLIGLALVDAVNPCELAVLIILMTAILARDPTKKSKALKAGLAFSLAIFLMYFFFGLLIVFGFKSILAFTQFRTSLFYTLLAVLAIILGALNIKDAIWYGQGFLMEVPVSWRPKMKALIKGTTSTAGAFITGLVVSFFLTPCTAGPYFVAGGILAGVEWLTALPLLFMYLCIFIAPMPILTLAAYFGFMAVEDMAGWREKNVRLLHWAAGLLLLGLGAAMLLGFI